jgi:hypothetical protein
VGDWWETVPLDRCGSMWIAGCWDRGGVTRPSLGVLSTVPKFKFFVFYRAYTVRSFIP